MNCKERLKHCLVEALDPNNWINQRSIYPCISSACNVQRAVESTNRFVHEGTLLKRSSTYTGVRLNSHDNRQLLNYDKPEDGVDDAKICKDTNTSVQDEPTQVHTQERSLSKDNDPSVNCKICALTNKGYESICIPIGTCGISLKRPSTNKSHFSIYPSGKMLSVIPAAPNKQVELPKNSEISFIITSRAKCDDCAQWGHGEILLHGNGSFAEPSLTRYPLPDPVMKPCGKSPPLYPWRFKSRGRTPRLVAMVVFYVMALLCVGLYSRIFDGLDTRAESSNDPATGHVYRIKRATGRMNSSIHCLSIEEQSHGLPKDFLSKKFAENGGWLIHLLIGSYMFAAVANVCDVYFVPALEHISEDLDLQSDVAGATFMAVASSAPEFCTATIGVFMAKNDIGFGTIIGSSIFNLLVIIGACAIFAGMPVQLTWYPLTRDSIFYMLSVALIGLFMQDSLITWLEALIMIMAYMLYIITMLVNKKMEEWCTYQMKAHHVVESSTSSSVDSARKRLQMLEARRYSRISGNSDCKPMLTNTGIQEVERLGLNPADFTCNIFPTGLSLTEIGMKLFEARFHAEASNLAGRSADPIDSPKLELEEGMPQEEDISKAEHVHFHKKEKVVVSIYENPLKFPTSLCGRCYWIIILPFTLLHAFTIPDSRLLGTWQAKVYLLSFALSVLYIGFYCYIMVWMISLAGDVLRIPSTITGLTVIAAGTSVPDLLASVFVARDGYGDMAVSNALGSNVFDILICLGIPWMIDALFVNKEGTPINSEGMFFAVLTLLLSIVYLWGSMKCFNWTLTPTYGVVTILVYIAVTMFCILIETNNDL